jgi:hypothetical protein
MKMIDENTFAHACIEQNTIDELFEAFRNGPDRADMLAWGLSENEWREQINLAIDYLKRLYVTSL